MADFRLKDIATTAAVSAADDFLELDGATNASRKITPGAAVAQFRNALAPRGGVAFDGTGTAQAQATLTGQSLGTDALSVSAMVAIPATNPATIYGLWCLSSISAGFGGSDFYPEIGTGGVLTISLRNAANSAVFNATVTANIVTTYGGKTIHLLVTRSGATLVIYINGVSVAFTTAGSNDTNSFAQAVVSTYFRVGNSGASRAFVGTISAATLYNLALSAADVLEIYELDGAVPERFKYGSQGNAIASVSRNSDFSAGATDWPTTGTNYTGALSGGAFNMAFSVSGYNNVNTTLPGSKLLVVGPANLTGRQWRIKIDVSNFTGTGTSEISLAAATAINNIAGNGTSVATIVEASGNGPAASGLIILQRSASVATSFTIDNVVFQQLGAVIHLPLDDGLGFQLKDISTNRLHALATTTGVSHVAPLYAPARVRAVTDGTTTAQKLCGGTTLPAACQILRIRARAQAGTPNLILGSSSGGTQIVASVALSTTWKDLTIALTGGVVSAATDLWATASTANVVELDLTWEPLSP